MRQPITMVRPSAYWYARAEEAIAKADACFTQPARLTYLEMAQSYAKMAERAKQREDREKQGIKSQSGLT